MATDYKLVFKDTSGAVVAQVVDFWRLSYTKKVNEPGLASVVLADDATVQGLGHKYQLEIWRRDEPNEIDWYCDFYGFFMDRERSQREAQEFQLYAPGQMTMLDWRYVLWYANETNRSAFTTTAAETIIKTLGQYNVTGSALTINGRMRDGEISGISIEADGGGGNSLDWRCAWRALLRELQEIASVGGGDFDLVKTGDAAWELRWYAGQRGSDLTGSVIFSPGRGNMGNPRYRLTRSRERPVAVAGGQGVGDLRKTVVRTGTDYAADNDVELFVQASGNRSTAGLQASADAALDKYQARYEFFFDVIQSPACLYGKHYCVDGVVGDLVTAVYEDVETTQKITGVTVGVYEDGRERIDVDLETQ